MILKWIFDRVVSLLGLLILWLVLLVVAILIKVKMPGGRATLKYRLEDEMIADYVASQQAAGDMRDLQDIAVEYNDTVIYPDKVRINCYYYRHYSFVKDIQMIFCTVLGKNMKYNNEII